MIIKKVICLGIGSNSFGKLNTVSFAVETEADWILIDCGPDTPRQVQGAGIPFEKIKTVILTHSHMDHCLGLPYLMFGRHLSLMSKFKSGEETPDLCIVSEDSLWENILGIVKSLHPEIPKLTYGTKHIEITSSAAIEINNIKLETVRTEHTVSSFGVKLSDKNGIAFAYSSDTIPSNSFEELAKGSNCVVVEGMVPEEASMFAKATKHSTVTEAGEAAKRINCQATYLAHLRPIYFDRINELEEMASSAAGFPVRFPKEGETILENK